MEREILRADALALSLRAAMDRIALPLARAAAAFIREEAWCVFGYARIEDHARERFGRTSRWVRDLGDIGRRLDELPGLARAMTGDDGGAPIGTVAARRIARIASAESLDAWVATARRLTARELEIAVRQARQSGSVWPGGDESDPGTSDSRDLGNDADGIEPHRLIRFLVPLPVSAAFDEALDLYRAVEGCEATVTSFIEALVADAMAGADPPDLDSELDRVGLNRGESREVAELALAHSTGNWSHLPAAGRPDWALALAGASLSRFTAIATGAGQGDAVALDRQIRDLLEVQDDLDRRLGDLLRQMGEMGAWSRLRYDSVEHYAEQRLGMCRTAARQRVRAARGLRRFPILREAYERGEIGLESTIRIVRILGDGPADEATQTAWVEHGRAATVKRIRDEERALSRRRAQGEGADPGSDGASRAPQAPHTPLPDEVWHASLRREPGMARERVASFSRDAAAVAGRRAAGRPGADVFLRLRLPGPLADDLAVAVETERLRIANLVEQVAWDRPWPDATAPGSVLAARMFSIRCRRTPAWIGLLGLLETFVATWDTEDPEHRQREREVYARDGYRCGAPGCTSRRNLHSHHLRYRSRHGGEALSNKTCLCAFHHLRGEHGDLARCRGEAPLGIVWRIGRKDVGVWFRNETRTPSGTSTSR